jgi:hypothetical protein
MRSKVLLTSIITGIALWLSGTAPAAAQEALAHVNASVVGALNVSELFAIKFGNFAIACTNNACDALSSIVLADDGTRTVHSSGVDNVALFNGNGSGGITNGTAQETGSQSPGFYNINTGGETPGSGSVYVSFADVNGDLIDINHPANHVTLSGPLTNAFTVDAFTFESDTGTTGYQQLNPSTTDVYGTYVPLPPTGTINIRVGATLHTVAGPTPPPGQYTGQFYIMASY